MKNTINYNLHYCKICDIYFYIKIGEKESGDFFLICPKCGWKHYRHFEEGIAIHCDITQRKGDIITLH